MPNTPDAKKGIKKETLVGTFLVANAFVWYLSAFSYLREATNIDNTGNLLLQVAAINFASMVLAGFAVSILSAKIKDRLVFLKYWTLAGIVLSALFAFSNMGDPNALIVMASIVGIYFGAGMPTCMGYYAKTTVVQNRAKSSGIIILLIGVCLPLFSIIGSQGVYLAAGLAVWRLFALAAALSVKPVGEQIGEKEKVTFRTVVSNKAFLLYVVPWLMFSLINDLTMQLNINYFNSPIFPAEFGQNFILIENILAGASAIICGVFADKKGRKRLALTGFVLLGVGYAALGLFNGDYYTALFYVCADGFAWGALSMLFILTIWGDIAKSGSGEKYYFVGVLPYLFSSLIRVLIGTYISAFIDESMVFSFASFFLFLSILPLAYAPETLSDKIMRKQELNSYVAMALAKAEKEKTKNKKR